MILKNVKEKMETHTRIQTRMEAFTSSALSVLGYKCQFWNEWARWKGQWLRVGRRPALMPWCLPPVTTAAWAEAKSMPVPDPFLLLETVLSRQPALQSVAFLNLHSRRWGTNPKTFLTAFSLSPLSSPTHFFTALVCWARLQTPELFTSLYLLYT